jgi:hypothetical protein
MHGPWIATRRARLSSVAAALLLAAACGDGGMQAHVALDAAPDVRADAADAGSDRGAAAADGGDASDDVEVDAALDATAEGPDAVAGDRGPPADAADASEARVEASTDLPRERPSATAAWTIAPNSMCTADGAGCMDTGTVGGYQITASGRCPSASDVQLWFPGGATPLAAGTYAVKAAAGILDVIAMPAGMVGVLAERDDVANTHFRFWGRAGTVTVIAAGSARRVAFTEVTLREQTSGAMTTLAADVTCP